MLESARLHGIEVELIGRNEPYNGNFDAKVRRLLPAIQKSTGHDFVIIIDAADVLFATDLGEIHYNFQNIGKPFLAAAERNCSPDIALAKKHPNQDKTWKYLNSGFFMATWDEFVKQTTSLLNSRAYLENTRRSDQRVWQLAWLNGDLQLQLDCDCRCCCCFTLCNTNWAECLNPDFQWGKRVFNKRTRTYPCIYHFNGRGKSFQTGVNSFIFQ